MTVIWQAAIHTPWWVYLLFIVLIKIGINASKTRTRPLAKLFILPLVFTFMSIHTLITTVVLDTFNVSTWTIALLAGVSLGFYQVFVYQLQVDKKRLLIKVPGSWSILIWILFIFVSKYYFNYQLAVSPNMALHTGFAFSLLATSGVITGLFIGKLLCYLYRFFTLAQTDLTSRRS
jgi:hypothetical protein